MTIQNSTDLTSLNDVKVWAEVALDNHNDDSTIQDIITGFSVYVFNVTGIESFSAVGSHVENRDGNGNDRIFTRNRPIVSVSAVTVNGVAIPESTVYPNFGWFVSDDRKMIVIRGSNPASFSNLRSTLNTAKFTRGVGNVRLEYTAGFSRVPNDLEMAARKACAIFYRRRQNLDLESRAVSAAGSTGTTRFRDWEVPPEVQSVIDFYSRLAII